MIDLGRRPAGPAVDRAAHDLLGARLHTGFVEHVLEPHALQEGVADEVAADLVRHARQRDVALDLRPCEQVGEASARSRCRRARGSAGATSPSGPAARRAPCRCGRSRRSARRTASTPSIPRSGTSAGSGVVDRWQSTTAAESSVAGPRSPSSTSKRRCSNRPSPPTTTAPATRRRRALQERRRRPIGRRRGARRVPSQPARARATTSTPIDTACRRSVGSSLPNVGAGARSPRHTRRSHRPPTSARTRRPLALTARMPTTTPIADPRHERSDDQHRLVGGAEPLDRPVLDRLGDRVDDLLTDRHDGRGRATDETDDQLGGSEPTNRGDEAEATPYPSGTTP